MTGPTLSPPPIMPPMRPMPTKDPQATSGRSSGMSVALFAGVFAVLLLVVIGVGLTRNSSENRNLVEVVFDGLLVLRDFAMQILGVVFD
jgi:hypothetical protein